MRALLFSSLVALAACKPDAPVSAGPTSAPSAAIAPATATTTTPALSASAAAPSPTSLALTPLPPPAPNKTPIRDCKHPSEEEGDFSCCSEEGAAQIDKMIVNRTIAECKKIDALPRFAACPTFFARGFHGQIEGCFQGALERELDRRLLPLKKIDETAFHREMKLQKSFNDAVRKTCDEVLMKEQSTGDFRGAFRCTTFLIELREKQGRAINDGGMENAHDPAAKVTRGRHFRPFAAELCAIPSLWKGPAPTPCEERVLGEIEDALAAASKF